MRWDHGKIANVLTSTGDQMLLYKFKCCWKVSYSTYFPEIYKAEWGQVFKQWLNEQTECGSQGKPK